MALTPEQLNIRSVLESWRDAAVRERTFKTTSKAIEEAETTAHWLMETKGFSLEQKFAKMLEGLPAALDKINARMRTKQRSLFRPESHIAKEEATIVGDRLKNLRNLIIMNQLPESEVVELGQVLDRQGVFDKVAGEFELYASENLQPNSSYTTYLDIYLDTNVALGIDASLSLETRPTLNIDEPTFSLGGVFPVARTEKGYDLVFYNSGKNAIGAMTRDEFTVVNYYLSRIIRRLPTV